MKLRLTAISGLLVSISCPASIYCVSTPAELTSALATSERGTTDDEIRIRAGVYDVPNGGWTIDVHRKGLTLSGSFIDAACQSKSSDASSTVLDGRLLARPLTIDTSFQGNQSGGEILISDLTIQNGVGDVVGGLKVSDAGPIYNGAIRIERIIFRNNTATDYRENNSAGGLLAATDGSTFDGATYLIVRNNLFEGNRAKDKSAAMLFSDNSIAVNNNTFVYNQSFDPTIAVRTVIGAISPSKTYYTNNIFWYNNPESLSGSYDLSGNNPPGVGRVTLMNNDYESVIGESGILIGNIRYEPHFISPELRDFHLRSSSGLVDGGVDAPPQGGIGNVDLDGTSRRQGQFIDFGAYESTVDSFDVILSDGFE